MVLPPGAVFVYRYWVDLSVIGLSIYVFEMHYRYAALRDATSYFRPIYCGEAKFVISGMFTH